MDLTSWCRVEALTGDASPRRYSRLSTPDDETALLVEYPESIRHQLPRDLEVFSWCRRHGLRVPNLHAVDLESGCAVIEDLGLTDAEHSLESSSPVHLRGLFEDMLGPLEILAKIDPDDLPRWNPPLDRARLRWELAGFQLWYVRHLRSKSPSAELDRWLDELAVEVAGHPRRVCHRDYHINNILIQPDGSIGIIDVQDILIGPDTYDLVSLTAERAATRLISPADRDLVLETWARNTEAEPGWRDRVAAMQTQRHLKVLGDFARFTAAGRTEYRDWLTELAGNLAERLHAAGAPPGVITLLLD